MKKLAILTVAFLLSLNVGQLKAQDNMVLANTELKIAHKEKRIEKRGDRRELKRLEGTKVSDLSIKNFKTDFAKAANARWTRTPNYDIAAFTYRGQELKAYYDADGQLVGTTQFKKFDDLPDKGQKIILQKYKGYEIGQILFFNNNEVNRSPMLLWGTEVLDKSNYFVELAKGSNKKIIYVDPGGNVSLFKNL
jgi:hypothetical protein